MCTHVWFEVCSFSFSDRLCGGVFRERPNGQDIRVQTLWMQVKGNPTPTIVRFYEKRCTTIRTPLSFHMYTGVSGVCIFSAAAWALTQIWGQFGWTMTQKLIAKNIGKINVIQNWPKIWINAHESMPMNSNAHEFQSILIPMPINSNNILRFEKIFQCPYFHYYHWGLTRLHSPLWKHLTP